jgi:hypothetical protein
MTPAAAKQSRTYHQRRLLPESIENESRNVTSKVAGRFAQCSKENGCCTTTSSMQVITCIVESRTQGRRMMALLPAALWPSLSDPCNLS